MTTPTTRPLRIAHLSFSTLPLTVGGLETVVDNLIRSQIEAGHRVELVTRWKQAQALRAAPRGYPVHALPPRLPSRGAAFADVGPRWPVALAVAAHQLRHRFDVWHAHWLYPTAWMAHGALARLGVPLVATAHGADVNTEEATGYGFRQFPRHDARLRRLLARAPLVTGVSPQLCARIGEIAELDARVVPNGIGYGAIEARATDRVALRQGLDVPEGAALVLSVSRNQPSKGLQHIPEALRRLKDAGHDLVWAIVGPDSDGLAPLFAAAGLSGAVRLLPAIPKPATDRSMAPPEALIDLYRSADIFVFPTHNEAFGLVALEAMAAGTATVASDVGGLKGLIASGETGLLIPPGDPAAIAAAVHGLLADPARRAALATAGRQAARAYDWPNVAASYLSLYREAIASGSRP